MCTVRNSSELLTAESASNFPAGKPCLLANNAAPNRFEFLSKKIMHSCNLDVEINKLSKIEGHADLDIKIREGKLEEVNLKVMENLRFFNQAVEGQSYAAVPQLVSRICGTCSIAHLTGCIEAVEKTLGVVPSEQTMILRKLTVYSMMIRDHALHLYFFAMPDMLGIDSLLDVPEDKHDLIHDALAVKEAGNNLSELVAGRAVHAPFEQVGGFSREIDEKKIPAMIDGAQKNPADGFETHRYILRNAIGNSNEKRILSRS